MIRRANLLRIGVRHVLAPPQIATGAALSIVENAPFSVGLLADQTVNWSILGGADAAKFSILGSTLLMTAKDFEAPTDANADNVYQVTVLALNALTGKSSTKAIAVTVTDALDVAPTITSGSAVSVQENATLSSALTANQVVTWMIVGGADQAKFELSGGSTLRFAGNVTKDFEAPDDADANNVYQVTVRATNAAALWSQQTILVTVTDVSDTGGVSFDYTVANQTELDALIASTNLSGKRVGLSAGGAYGLWTIQHAATAQPITFGSVNPANRTRIDRIVVNSNQADIVLEDLEIVTSAWMPGTFPALGTSGSSNSGDLTLRRCRLRGNYRGDVDYNFDPSTDNYPEYASIFPVVSGGVITALNITRPYTGDLLADGTYALQFNLGSPGGAAGTMTVVGGQIVSTTLTAGGSGYPSSGLGNVIRWDGQQIMASYLKYAIQNMDNNIPSGVLTVEDCEISLFNNAIKGAFSGGQYVTGCTYDMIYQDWFSIGSGVAPLPVWPIEYKWNWHQRPFSSYGDPGDPHSDGMQGFMDTSGTVTMGEWSWIIEGNIFIDMGARGGIQGIFLSDTPSGGATTGSYRARIVGNLIASSSSTHGLDITKGTDCYVYRNAFIRYNIADPDNTGPVTVAIANATSSVYGIFGSSFRGGNIVEQNNSPQVGAMLTNFDPDVAMGPEGSLKSYDSVFADPHSNPTTLAEVIAAWTPQPAYAGKGPFNADGYIDHVNRIIDVSMEPVLAFFGDVVPDQPVSTPTSTPWRRIVGGPATGPITVNAGTTYQFADDANGTNATVATGAAGTYTRDKYLRLTHTTSASPSEPVASTYRLNGWSWTWSTITASAASFDTVDNNVGAAYSKVATPSTETGVKKLIMAYRYRLDAVATLRRPWGGGNTLSPQLRTGNRYALWAAGLTYAETAKAMVLGEWQTDVIALDLTKTDPEEGIVWVRNGSPLSFITDPSWTPAAAGLNMATLLSSSFGLFGLGSGADRMDGAMQFFWMHWGDATLTLPDITDPNVSKMWLADKIGANGQGPLGVTPKLFYTGAVGAADGSEANTWNATGGLDNKGTLAGKPAIRQGTGVYA